MVDVGWSYWSWGIGTQRTFCCSCMHVSSMRWSASSSAFSPVSMANGQLCEQPDLKKH